MLIKFIFSLGVLSFLLYFANPILAAIGVGVGTGKIQVDDKLAPGIIYELPPLTVLNTGDVAGEYGVRLAFHEGQPQMQPGDTWFTFKPTRFYLEPGQAQKVDITLNLPINAVPADYFTYLEGYPIQVASDDGETAISIAAAAKLYFTISPANIFQGMYFRLKSLWNTNQPWSTVSAVILFGIILIIFLKKHLNIKIEVNKKS